MNYVFMLNGLMHPGLDFDEAVINACQYFSLDDGMFGFERQVQLLFSYSMF